MSPHDIEILHWFKINKDLLNGKIVNFKMYDEFLSPYKSFQASIYFNGRTFTGTGVHTVKELAMSIAISEAVERVFSFANKLSSTSGNSCHYDLITAQKKSKLELIERHAYLYHHINNIPFHREEVDLGEMAPMVNKISNYFSVNIDFYNLNPLDLSHFHLCSIRGDCAKNTEPFGLIIGMGASDSKLKSIQKSALEAISIFLNYNFKKEFKSMSLLEFNKLEFRAQRDHIKLGLDLDYGKKYYDSFFSTPGHHEKVPYKFSEYTYEKIDLDIAPFNTFPGVVVHAENKDVLELVFSNDIFLVNNDLNNDLNDDAMLRYDMINKFPHILG